MIMYWLVFFSEFFLWNGRFGWVKIEKKKQKKKNNEELFANPRNAAAGSVRQLDSKIAASRGLDNFSYHLPNAENYELKTHEEALNYIKKLGFVVNPNIKKVKNIDELLEYIEYWTKNRNSLPYEIDGIVFWVVNWIMQSLGNIKMI